MKYSEIELKRLGKLGKNATIEDKNNFNILNFIHCTYLNKQDFYKAAHDSKYFGELEMTFIKKENCLFGHCRVIIKKDDAVLDYVYSAYGFELLSDVVG